MTKCTLYITISYDRETMAFEKDVELCDPHVGEIVEISKGMTFQIETIKIKPDEDKKHIGLYDRDFIGYSIFKEYHHALVDGGWK